MDVGGTLSPRERVRKAVVTLADREPFYGTVAMHLRPEAVPDDPAVPTAGVLEDGRFLFDPEFVESLSSAQLRGLLAHEVLHLVLDFQQRRDDRDFDRWNTAQDAVINHMLVVDGFDLPDGGVVPEDGRLDLGRVVIEDLGSKTSESVYDELAAATEPLADVDGPNRERGEDAVGDATGENAGTETEDEGADDDRGDPGAGDGRGGDSDDAGGDSGDGATNRSEGGRSDRTDGPDRSDDSRSDGTDCPDRSEGSRADRTDEDRSEEESSDQADGPDDKGDGESPAARNPGGFDVHLDDDGRFVPDDERPDWDRIARSAAAESDRRSATGGDAAGAAVETVRRRLSASVDWRAVLRETLTGRVAADYAWSRPADKSRRVDAYLPSTESRRVEGVVALDTSASMSRATLAAALGELHALAREYDELSLTLLQHDVEVQAVERDWRPTVDDVDVQGRGGTSHEAVFAWLREHRPGARLLIALTDGRTDLPDLLAWRGDLVWVLVGSDPREPSVGTVVRVPDGPE